MASVLDNYVWTGESNNQILSIDDSNENSDEVKRKNRPTASFVVDGCNVSLMVDTGSNILLSPAKCSTDTGQVDRSYLKT